MWESLLTAIGLLLILEGIIPFLYPSKWRVLVSKLATVSDSQLRLMGLFSMLIGLGALYFIN